MIYFLLVTQKEKWRKMTINFFFECFFFISAPSHSPSPFPLLPIVRFCKLASSSKRIPFNVAFLPPAQIVFTLRLQPVNVWFGSLTRKIFSWLEKNKRRDWIGTNRSKLMLPLRERFFSAAPKVGLKAFLLRMPMSINYSICRHNKRHRCILTDLVVQRSPSKVSCRRRMSR